MAGRTFRDTELMGHSLDVETGRAVNRDEHGGFRWAVDGSLDQPSGCQLDAAGEEQETSPIQRRSHGGLLVVTAPTSLSTCCS